jgi:hypothetical protein
LAPVGEAHCISVDTASLDLESQRKLAGDRSSWPALLELSDLVLIGIVESGDFE